MHTLLLTVVMVAGADANYGANTYSAGMYAGDSSGKYSSASDGSGGMGGGGCNSCGAGGHHQGGSRFGRRANMPQYCYDPKYGCYGNDDRHFQRYPAFAGTYYRRPYNYRNLFDYPWHADLHEPTSLFSYNVPNEPRGGYGPGGTGNGYGPNGGPVQKGDAIQKGSPQPPAPLPSDEASQKSSRRVETANQGNSVLK